jgi:hypothetical protein
VKQLLSGAVILAALAAAAPAFAVTSRYSATSSETPDAMWAKIGDFCGIGQWHPAVAKCTLSDDGKTRTLELKGGGTIVEKLVNRDDAKHRYTYTIESSPLPVDHYRSTIMVAKAGNGSKVVWSGTYSAKGASDADAKKAIDGVYKGGVDALVGK